MLRPSAQSIQQGGGSSSVMVACMQVEGLMGGVQAQETKQLFLAEGGVLVMLELLESENETVSPLLKRGRGQCFFFQLLLGSPV